MVLSVGGIGLKSQEANAAQVDGVTQAWDKNLPSASRFTVLAAFGGAAVRDNNTGLVWEQAPNATTMAWFTATGSCVTKNVGGTVGWRLPSVVELNSVRDPSLPVPFVPAGVFTGVQSANFLSANYWSATTLADNPPFAWFVNFFDGIVDGHNKTDFFHVWCVRGPMQESVY